MTVRGRLSKEGATTEDHQHGCDPELEGERDALGNDETKQNDDSADQHHHRRVPETPQRPCPGRASQALSLGDDGRHRRDVIRIGRVREAEHEAEREDREEVHRVGDPRKGPTRRW